MADRPPVIAAWGAGVDSTAMIVELAERGEAVDMVLFADLGAEKSETYAFIPLFRAWMAERGIASEIVRYQPRNFKHWPPYAGIAENMLTNATLPSVVFGGGPARRNGRRPRKMRGPQSGSRRAAAGTQAAAS